MSTESTMYQLYAYPNTYSIGAHLLLEEIGVAYRIVNPKINRALTDMAFYQASPHGRVPAIVLPDGDTMCESGAIALHLADTLCNRRFSVNAQSVHRARYLQWLFYLSSTLQPDVLMVFHPEYYSSNSEHQCALKAVAEKRLKGVWAELEKEYSNKGHDTPWLFEKGPTAVDFALANVLIWPECFPLGANTYPALTLLLDTLSQRASFKRIMAWHNLTTDEPPERPSKGS